MARQQPESKLVKKILVQLEGKLGGSWNKIHGGSYQNSGISDILGCVEGHYVALEVKVPGRENTLTNLQAKFLEEIRKAGGTAAMVTSPEQALEIVREGLENRRL